MEQTKCLMPKCERVLVKRGGGRGLCPSCYAYCYKSVIKGKTTWEELEELGLAYPSTRHQSLLAQALEALRLKKNGKVSND